MRQQISFLKINLKSNLQITTSYHWSTQNIILDCYNNSKVKKINTEKQKYMLKKLIHKIYQFNESKIKWYKDIYFIPLLLFILFLDQFTKFLVKNNLDLYQSWPAEGFFRITHGINTGIAFGLLENQSTILITILPIIAIGFLIYYYKKQMQSNRLIRIVFGLQLGGAFGNIVDRILLGSVVDFIDIGPWYIFNIADSSIVCGLILLIFFIVIQEQRYKNATKSTEKKQ